ncbi:na+ h+ exchanger, partial [Cystoisospora suis]
MTVMKRMDTAVLKPSHLADGGRREGGGEPRPQHGYEEGYEMAGRQMSPEPFAAGEEEGRWRKTGGRVDMNDEGLMVDASRRVGSPLSIQPQQQQVSSYSTMGAGDGYKGGREGRGDETHGVSPEGNLSAISQSHSSPMKSAMKSPRGKAAPIEGRGEGDGHLGGDERELNDVGGSARGGGDGNKGGEQERRRISSAQISPLDQRGLVAHDAHAHFSLPSPSGVFAQGKTGEVRQESGLGSRSSQGGGDPYSSTPPTKGGGGEVSSSSSPQMRLVSSASSSGMKNHPALQTSNRMGEEQGTGEGEDKTKDSSRPPHPKQQSAPIAPVHLPSGGGGVSSHPSIVISAATGVGSAEKGPGVSAPPPGRPQGVRVASLSRGEDEDAAELLIKDYQKEKHAHTLAALSQGLKPELSGGGGIVGTSSAFDPKFNLRLIEHATTADAKSAVGRGGRRLAPEDDEGDEEEEDEDEEDEEEEEEEQQPGGGGGGVYAASSLTASGPAGLLSAKGGEGSAAVIAGGGGVAVDHRHAHRHPPLSQDSQLVAGGGSSQQPRSLKKKGKVAGGLARSVGRFYGKKGTHTTSGGGGKGDSSRYSRYTQQESGTAHRVDAAAALSEDDGGGGEDEEEEDLALRQHNGTISTSHRRYQYHDRDLYEAGEPIEVVLAGEDPKTKLPLYRLASSRMLAGRSKGGAAGGRAILVGGVGGSAGADVITPDMMDRGDGGGGVGDQKGRKGKRYMSSNTRELGEEREGMKGWWAPGAALFPRGVVGFLRRKARKRQPTLPLFRQDDDDAKQVSQKRRQTSPYSFGRREGEDEDVSERASQDEKEIGEKKKRRRAGEKDHHPSWSRSRSAGALLRKSKSRLEGEGGERGRKAGGGGEEQRDGKDEHAKRREKEGPSGYREGGGRDVSGLDGGEEGEEEEQRDLLRDMPQLDRGALHSPGGRSEKDSDEDEDDGGRLAGRLDTDATLIFPKDLTGSAAEDLERKKKRKKHGRVAQRMQSFLHLTHRHRRGSDLSRSSRAFSPSGGDHSPRNFPDEEEETDQHNLHPRHPTPRGSPAAAVATGDLRKGEKSTENGESHVTQGGRMTGERKMGAGGGGEEERERKGEKKGVIRSPVPPGRSHGVPHGILKISRKGRSPGGGGQDEEEAEDLVGTRQEGRTERDRREREEERMSSSSPSPSPSHLPPPIVHLSRPGSPPSVILGYANHKSSTPSGDGEETRPAKLSSVDERDGQ